MKISVASLGPVHEFVILCISVVQAFVFVYFAKQLQLLGIFAAKIFWVDIVSFSLVKNLYFYIMIYAFVCIAYIDVPKVHWQTVENY